MKVIDCIMLTFCLSCQQNSVTWYVFMTVKIHVVVVWVMTTCTIVWWVGIALHAWLMTFHRSQSHKSRCLWLFL